MATFRCGGLTLAYDDIGSGEAGTIVLAHGFATSRAENWGRLGWYAAFERKGWRLLAPDLRGHGESDKPHDPALYDRGDMAGDLIALMDHAQIGRADLMGYSMGAHVALEAAFAYPDRVGSLILGGVGARLLSGGGPSPNATLTMAEALRAADPESIDDRTLRGFRQYADNEGADREALAACAEGRGKIPAREDLARIASPTLVVAGALDQIAGDPQALADAILAARAVTVPACDHFSAIPHALFKAAVFDFLEGWLDEA